MRYKSGMGLTFYWIPREAIISTVIATIGMGGIYYTLPGLHPLAYVAGWLVLAGLLYQTGCEFSERTRRRQLGQRR
jgi:hypothetical protein